MLVWTEILLENNFSSMEIQYCSITIVTVFAAAKADFYNKCQNAIKGFAEEGPHHTSTPILAALKTSNRTNFRTL